MAGIEPNWSRIPEDLLFSIIKHLPARVDILRLRAVCRLFRATIPLPPLHYPFPNSILTDTEFLKGTKHPNKNDVFTLTTSTVYTIEPLNRIFNTEDEETPHMWVVRVNESNSGRVQIIDPMTGKNCQTILEKLPKSLNLLDYRVTEIRKYYQLDSIVEFIFPNVVFSSFLDEHDDEFAVMVRLRYDDLSELGMWRNVDKKWSRIHIGCPSCGCNYMEDIIYYNNKFYGSLVCGRTVIVDPKSLLVTQVAASLPFNGSFEFLSLVGSVSDLLMVRQFPEYEGDDDEDSYDIEVFKLNQKKRKWVPVVDGLDFRDRVLFVGNTGYTFFVSVKEFPGFKGGCFYYVANSSDDGGEHYPGYLNCFRPASAWFNDQPQLKANAIEEKQRRGSGDDCERKIPRLMP